MQLSRSMALLALLALACVFSPVEASRLSPVTRVVELLKGLAAKTEADGKAEEELYETFVCWAKSMVSQKTKSNEAAEARSDELKTYIDDLANGRIELTTERADLTKQLEELNTGIETATQLREKEKKDYEDAKDEMEKAIDALTKAVEVLGTATKDHKEGVLLSMRAKVGSSFGSRAQEAEALSRAVELGDRVLTQADAGFLRRVLTGEVPKADWKKLNRKATFKMDYKARSFKIQDVLAKLLQDFSGNLLEASKKEEAAVALYDKLMESKGAEKAATEEALAKMEKENGARGLSKEESQAELDSLTTQLDNDKKYIEQVQKSLAEKKVEWKDRLELRTGELAAISKAIEILHSDDARDLLKKSMASQGFLFLQESSLTRAKSAVEVLKRSAKESHDARLSELAARAAHAGTSHFVEVVTAIDKMVKVLQAEEAEDLQKKEQCETNRAADTRSAIKTSRTMDELSDDITVGKSKIQEIIAEIKDKEDEVAATEQELKEATEMREKENAEWRITDKDDKDAKALVLSALDVLAKFYSENGLMLSQLGKKGVAAQPFESEAGKAPPPPPATWEAPYGGATEESTGIVSMLDIIAKDIQKDIQKAATEEEDAKALYQKSKAAMDEDIKNLNTAISELNGVKAETETAVIENTADRLSNKGDLDIVLTRIADANPGCDYFSINYPIRVKNRQVELDGLQKAKTILSGGEFTPPEDPNRAMKPGDALLQVPRLAKFFGRHSVL